MARWALYILVVLNLAAFLWFYNQTPVAVDKQNATSPKLHNSERIKLVKPNLTKPQSQREFQPEPQLSTEGLTQNTVDGNIGEATLIKLPEPIEPIEPIVENPPSLTAETVEVEAVEVKTFESKKRKTGDTETKVEKKPPIEKIVLEKKSNDAPVVKKPVVPEIITPPKVTTASKLSTEEQQLLAEMSAYAEADPEVAGIEPVQVCYQYGPLNNKQADALTSDFRDQDIPVVQQSRIITKDAGFLVMVSPLASEAQANQQVQRVKNAGLDAFTITKGEWLHGISLGIFSSKANANKLFSKAKKLLPNNSVELKPRFREVSVFRLIFSLEQSRDPDKLLAISDFPPIDVNNPPKLAKKSCESVEF